MKAVYDQHLNLVFSRVQTINNNYLDILFCLLAHSRLHLLA